MNLSTHFCTYRRSLVFALVSVLTLALTFGVTSSALAQASNAWEASYWNNISMAGDPVLQRNETEISYDWGDSSPAPGLLPSDRFSARWTRTLNLPAGRYEFTVRADDGVRLWVNNQQIIDRWTVQSANTFRQEIELPGGNIPVRLEYFENTADATVQLDWQRITREPQTGAWRGEYFNNTTLSGTPVYVDGTDDISFNWTTDSPQPGIVSNDNFSVRWTRTLNLRGGEYRFTARADDGVRVWVDGELIIDGWRVQSPTTYEATTTVTGGDVPVRVEYFDEGAGASIFLDWTQVSVQPPSAPPPSIPPSAPPATGAPLNTWRGEYFNGTDPSGNPALVRFNDNLDFNWGAGSPAPDQIGSDYFSVRWSRTLNLNEGRYRFTARTDDGVRLWVNGELVINQWNIHSVQSYDAVVAVEGGAVPVTMEYFENTGDASASLTWTRLDATQPPSAPPATVLPTGEVVRAYRLNMRTGPGIIYPSIGLLAFGDDVRMVGRDATATWIQVIAPDGRTVWVHGFYLSSNTALSSLPITVR